MLKRLYIDNFRCFDDFEFKPGSLQLILGGNGSGKSSFVDALVFLRQFIVEGVPLDDLRPLSQRTRWLKKPVQTFEFEVAIGRENYGYHLEVEPSGTPPRARVKVERVSSAGKTMFTFEDGMVHLNRSGRTVSYETDGRRSALGAMTHDIKTWLQDLHCFRINPFRMGSRAQSEALFPRFDLSNISAWYRHLIQTSPRENELFRRSLAESIDGFELLRFQSVGEGVNLLRAEFHTSGTFSFKELSDGQRCLIALYMVLHFIIAKNRTVVIDEPENFISLREIQPWLMTLRAAAEDAQGQVLLVSHHPEIIDQLAPESGVIFVRTGSGAARAEPFRADGVRALTASEVVARGWERE